MNQPRARVLFVDDDAAMRSMVTAGLQRRGYAVVSAGDGEAALAAAAAGFDAAVTDLNLASNGTAGTDGIELCRALRQAHPDLPVLVLTAFGSLDTAVQAIRAGAYDFLSKPLDLDALALAIDRAAEWRRLCSEVRRLRQQLDPAPAQVLLGDSAPMQQLRQLVGRLGPAAGSVLVTGETGTGKELVARALHAASDRADRPFVAVNCAAIAPGMLESELFGHVRGAFTDAVCDRPGLFQQSDGGTLFLDEIAELEPALQPKLLRALQEQRVRPVGSDREVAVDVRVVAATHDDLGAAVADGRFRQDLFYRLDVLSIAVPPLRRRGGDVLQLAQHFTMRAAARAGRRVLGPGPEAARLLLAYPWPGNVRELENAIESAVALTAFDQFTPADLPPKLRAVVEPGAGDAAGSGPLVSLAQLERAHILRVLDAVGGSRTAAARVLGLDRKTLYRKLRRYAAEGDGSAVAAAGRDRRE